MSKGMGYILLGSAQFFLTGKDNNTTEQYNVEKQSVWKRLIYS